MNADSVIQSMKMRHLDILNSPVVSDISSTAEMERLRGLSILALVLDSV